MRFVAFTLAAALIAAASGPGAAQGEHSRCRRWKSRWPVRRRRPSMCRTGKLLRIIGAQDAVARTDSAPATCWSSSGGTGAGVQLGQQYFVRRANRFGTAVGSAPLRQGARTGGWVRIVAVNEIDRDRAFDHDLRRRARQAITSSRSSRRSCRQAPIATRRSASSTSRRSAGWCSATRSARIGGTATSC